MYHMKAEREILKKESRTDTLLVKMFRYHIMHNQLSNIRLLKREFLIEMRLGISCHDLKYLAMSKVCDTV